MLQRGGIEVHTHVRVGDEEIHRQVAATINYYTHIPRLGGGYLK